MAKAASRSWILSCQQEGHGGKRPAACVVVLSELLIPRVSSFPNIFWPLLIAAVCSGKLLPLSWDCVLFIMASRPLYGPLRYVFNLMYYIFSKNQLTTC